LLGRLEGEGEAVVVESVRSVVAVAVVQVGLA
jgi:hypothetical protein